MSTRRDTLIAAAGAALAGGPGAAALGALGLWGARVAATGALAQGRPAAAQHEDAPGAAATQPTPSAQPAQASQSRPAEPSAASAPSVRLHRLRTGDLGGLLAVEVAIEAHDEDASGPGATRGLWLVDSGSTAHLIDRALALRLGLEGAGSVELATAGGRQRVERVWLPPLRLAEAGIGPAIGPKIGPRIGAAQALAVDLQAVRDVAGDAVQGLLGAPLLAGRVARFDLAAGTLALDVEPWPAAQGAVEVPLRASGGLVAFEPQLAPGIAGDCLFDTGNAGSVVLFAHAAERLVRDRHLPMLVSRELGGVVEVAYARSAEAAIGSYRRREVPIALERGGSARRGGHFDRLLGSVGVALFEGAAFTLDLKGGRLQILGGAAAGSALPGGFGFAVTRHHDGRLMLDRVLQGGPAERAGLQPGDLLAGLDGGLAPTAPAVLWGALHGRDDAMFELERDSRRWQARLARAVFFPLLG